MINFSFFLENEKMDKKQQPQVWILFDKPADIAGVSQCVHAVAELELAGRGWVELVPTLLHTSTSPAHSLVAKLRTIETIGYICETLKPELVEKLMEYLDEISILSIVGLKLLTPEVLQAASANSKLFDNKGYVQLEMAKALSLNTKFFFSGEGSPLGSVLAKIMGNGL